MLLLGLLCQSSILVTAVTTTGDLAPLHRGISRFTPHTDSYHFLLGYEAGKRSLIFSFGPDRKKEVSQKLRQQKMVPFTAITTFLLILQNVQQSCTPTRLALESLILEL